MPVKHQRYRISTHEPVKQAGVFARPAEVIGQTQSHDHDFMEIVLVIGGSGLHRTLYGQRKISRGDVLVVGPRTWHAYEQCRKLRVWNCGIGERLLKRELAWVMDDAVLGPMLSLPAGSTAEGNRGVVEGGLPVGAIAAATDALRQIERAANQPVRLGGLLTLLGIVGPAIAGAGKPRAPQALPMHPAVMRVMQAMRQSVATDWSLDRMAQIGRVDRSYLVRLFRKHTGQSPMAMLLRWRCESAAALLIETNEPVAGVGMKVGWADINYFGRRFRCHFGRPPTQFHAAHRSAGR